jgi:arginase
VPIAANRHRRRMLIAGSLQAHLGGNRRCGLEGSRPVQIDIIPSRSNLGLKPNVEGQAVGTWRAADVLVRKGLADRLGGYVGPGLDAPPYDYGAQSGTRIRNGRSIREYSLELADQVEQSLRAGRFPLVLGGDCSNLLGCLYAVRRVGGRGLVHLDGHSDFSNPTTYDFAASLGPVAGMDLALATGRGESLLTSWPGIEGSLACDEDVIQLGDRETLDPDYTYPDIFETKINRITIQEMRAIGLPATIERFEAWGRARAITRAFLHLDLDVLDQGCLPAVDTPGSPGLDYAGLTELLAALLRSGRICALDVAIYDPELDPGGLYADRIVTALVAALMRSVECVAARAPAQ